MERDKPRESAVYFPSLLWLCLLFCVSPAAAKRYSFDHFGQEQGLANSLVRAIVQDQTGFLWVATRGGLFRYDGIQFQHFGASDGLPDENIRSLHVTPGGDLWVGSAKGLSKRAGNRFVPAGLEHEITGRLSIASGKQGHVFAATIQGLFFAAQGKPFTPLGQPPSPRRKPVAGVWVDHDGGVWYGCGSEICHWDGTAVTAFGEDHGVPPGSWSGFQRDRSGTLLARNGVQLLVRKPGQRGFSPDPSAIFQGSTQILLDHSGRLLLPANDGIYTRGLEGKWEHISEERGLPASRVNCLLEDREGLLWIGFADLGMARWRGRGEWETYTSADGLLKNEVTAVRRSSDGALWVGSRAGVSRLDPVSGQWRRFTGAEGLEVQDVRALAATADGWLWVASAQNGLARIHATTFRIERIRPDSGLDAMKILSLSLDREGRLWVAAREGVYAAQPASSPRFTRMFAEAFKPGEEIYAARQDRHHRWWLAGNRGLLRQENGRWTRYGESDGLLSSTLVLLAFGPDDSVWVGYGPFLGLSRLRWDHGRLQITHSSRSNALYSNDLSLLEADRRGRLWVGTDNGVDVFNGTRWRHFSSRDGLAWHDIVLNAFQEDPDGSVWFGTNLGLSHYFPPRDMFESQPPVAALTSLRFNGVPQEPFDNLEIPYHRRLAQIGFTTLSFSRQHVTQFRYRLNGLDSVWAETREREAIFPNLSPGGYEFQVQAGAQGMWNPTSATLNFRILAPWWRSSWFLGGIALFLCAAAIAIYRRKMRYQRRCRQQLELAVAERTRELEQQKDRTESEKRIVETQKREIEQLLEKAQEASRLKGEFLANVSHEIRTPMNGILGMTSLALQTPLSSDQRDYLETAKDSGEALLSLLNDILDFSKIEANRLELEAVLFSLRGTLRESVRTLALQAHDKGLALSAEPDHDIPDALIGDPTRLRQILLNLLSNGIKFTTLGGVKLSIQQETREGPSITLRFMVKDTGCGIAPGKQGFIFEAFRQADGSTTRKHGGTGLGLAICSRLVNMMGGAITVESEVGKGSVFSFTACFQVASVAANNGPRPANQQLGKLAAVLQNGGFRPMRVLVAEDNLINRKLVVRLLEKQGHEVEVATDGRQALNMTSQKQYHLVLMDVQMPEIDGIETTRLIREREKITGDHLPILILTANAMLGDREKCLESGADGYLPKPFSIDLLTRAVEDLAQRGKDSSA